MSYLAGVGIIVRWITTVVLELLFVMANLMLDFIRRDAEGRHQISAFTLSNELMFVFRFRHDLNSSGTISPILMHIDCHFNEIQTIKVLKKLFSFTPYFILVFFTQMAVSR